MILWFGITQIAAALIAGMLCFWQWALKRSTNDYTLGATLLVGLLLVAQIIVAIMQPFVGNPAAGDPLEFWMYLIVAAILPFGAGFWALIDRRRSANLVLMLMNFAVGVMVYRMLVIWLWY